MLTHSGARVKGYGRPAAVGNRDQLIMSLRLTHEP